ACGDPGLFQVLVNLSDIRGYSCNFPTTDYIYVLRDEVPLQWSPQMQATSTTQTTPSTPETYTEPPSSATPATPTVPTIQTDLGTPTAPRKDSPTRDQLEQEVSDFKTSTAVFAVVSGIAVVAIIVKAGVYLFNRGCPRVNNECCGRIHKMLRPKVGTR
ncbi:unnamed protein product, partial [Lymnaea stagnalis]